MDSCCVVELAGPLKAPPRPSYTSSRGLVWRMTVNSLLRGIRVDLPEL